MCVYVCVCVCASCHVTSCLDMSYHIISYHIISYHIISYQIMTCHIISDHVISWIIRDRMRTHGRCLFSQMKVASNSDRNIAVGNDARIIEPKPWKLKTQPRASVSSDSDSSWPYQGVLSVPMPASSAFRFTCPVKLWSLCRSESVNGVIHLKSIIGQSAYSSQQHCIKNHRQSIHSSQVPRGRHPNISMQRSKPLRFARGAARDAFRSWSNLLWNCYACLAECLQKISCV